MQNISVTLLQSDINWENPKVNLQKYSELLKQVTETDIILFPEMFTTGFTMSSKQYAEPMNGGTVQWMKEIALARHCAVAGSLIILDNRKYYNRLVWVFPDGSLSTYDKKHLFSMGNEHENYTPGNKRLIVECKGWKICPLVCYDLRFPVWSRNTENYDLLVYLANWPVQRQIVWDTLLAARAIENQCYCIGVNRVGIDKQGIRYGGRSVFVTPKAETFFLGEKEQVQTFELSLGSLQNFRKNFPVLDDRDNFNLV